MAQNFVTGLNPVIVTVTAGVANPTGPWYFKTEQLDSWGVLADWTGTVAGSFKVEAGAGMRDVANLASFAGKFTDVTSTFSPVIINPAGSAGNEEIAAVFWTAPWMRLTFTPTGGTGVLTLYFYGKKS